LVHDGIHAGTHRLADLGDHGLDLALMGQGRPQGLAEPVEPGIDGRRELLATGRGQVDLERCLVHEPVKTPVEINRAVPQ
jgi:hypothetical protein